MIKVEKLDSPSINKNADYHKKRTMKPVLRKQSSVSVIEKQRNTSELLTPVSSEKNKVFKINFMNNMTFGGANQMYQDQADDTSFKFTMKSGDVLEPHYFVRGETTLTLKQSRKLSFLGHHLTNQKNAELRRLGYASPGGNSMGDNQSIGALTRNMSCSSFASRAKRPHGINPLYGHYIESIRCVKPGTFVYRIKSSVYDEFLGPDSFRKWQEKELLSVFPPQIRLEGSTKKQQEQMLKQFVIKEFQPSQTILRHRELPTEIYIMLTGEIQVLGHTREEEQDVTKKEIVTIKTEPGSRVSTLIQKGEEFGQVLCTREHQSLQENSTIIGEECDLLGIASPYSYICKKRTLVYAIKVETFFKELLNLNPLGLEQLKQVAALKIREFNKIAKDKKVWDQEVNNIKSIKQANDKRAQVEAEVRKQFPAGDKPVIHNIMNIVKIKEGLGEPRKMKNVEQRKIKGFITNDDIIRLSKLQNEYFPDYDFLKKCVVAQEEAIKNRQAPPALKDLMSKDDVKVYADNELIPLSYSGINDPQKIIYFEDKGEKTTSHKQGFFQKFPNPYFELCQEKLGSVDKKKELIMQEKKRQQEKSQAPSMGYFTSKVARSPSLFESMKHATNRINANWVLSDDQTTSFFSRRQKNATVRESVDKDRGTAGQSIDLSTTQVSMH